MRVPKSQHMRRPEHKSVAALSPDGLHWYKTGKAYDGPNPVWETTGDVQAGDLGKHLLLIPLKELDVGLQARPCTRTANRIFWCVRCSERCGLLAGASTATLQAGIIIRTIGRLVRARHQFFGHKSTGAAS